jgi:enamine deaminase RidA (YjgF/YER057c/UK114 family)
MPWLNVTVAHGFAFVAGTEGWDPQGMQVVPTLEDQTWLAHRKMAERFQEMGTSLENITMMTTYATRIPDVFREARFVTSKLWSDSYPSLLELPPPEPWSKSEASGERRCRSGWTRSPPCPENSR